ncbi:MAG: HAMP domain-containing histidine kinase [Nitrospirae bacterium]|nr:HAMP domain-containing histidine kinase [Nitrospirota bacterium]
MFRRFSFNPSLNSKLIFMMLMLSVMIISLLLFFNYQLEKNLLEEVERQTGELTKAIQIGVEQVTGSGKTDEARLSNYLKKLNKKGIREISIISNESEIVASTNMSKIGKPISHKKKELVIKAELGEHVSDEEKAYNVIIPVIADDVQYGYIHLMINKDDYSDLIKKNAARRIFSTLFAFSLCMLIIVIFSRRYTHPIKRIVEASLRVSAGDLNQYIPVESKDEIGQLAESFNFMVQKLNESRTIEERLREAEHLSGLGQLSRDIAHEIRNPLNFISLSIDYIGDKHKPEDADKLNKFQSLIAGIKQEIQRLDTLVNDFLDYSRPLQLNLKKVKVNDLLESVVALIWAKAEADGIKIVKNYSIRDIVLKLDPDLFKSCVLNIITNAFHAISLKNGNGQLSITTAIKDEKFVLSMIDNGIGISKDNLIKIFEPFFSTKQNHPGLGLPMTKRVIEEHGGRVEMNSEAGKGCEVYFYIPCPCDNKL